MTPQQADTLIGLVRIIVLMLAFLTGTVVPEIWFG